MEDVATLILLSLGALTLGEDIYYTMRRSPHRKESRPPTNSQHQCASHVNEPFWKQIFQLQSSLQMTAAQSNGDS